jgi:hypothetical protein
MSGHVVLGSARYAAPVKWLAAVVAGLALVFAPLAAAKDGLLFNRHTAHIGDRLTLSTAWMGHRAGVIVYLMPLAASPKWWPTYQAYAPASGKPPALRAAIRLGQVERWGSGGGRLQFRVPQVAPGRYVLGFWCVPCNTHWTSALPNFQPNPYGVLRIQS